MPAFFTEWGQPRRTEAACPPNLQAASPAASTPFHTPPPRDTAVQAADHELLPPTPDTRTQGTLSGSAPTALRHGFHRIKPFPTQEAALQYHKKLFNIKKANYYSALQRVSTIFSSGRPLNSLVMLTLAENTQPLNILTESKQHNKIYYTSTFIFA